ncbi:disulfide bond formation protein B [Aquabacterium soli]|jgi:protein dithiol:quinone oxidoreductase|uniref:Disulfide bond formation protein B n=1 Tax=Aquabacterium soli TaxID=2493092 RepID=A0A426VG11_9BURK|nr:disulfide bond formation protein B [Aquabacterium soli]RRS05863.1 disulfide bond formation protein B [Aquabacterium soli]
MTAQSPSRKVLALLGLVCAASVAGALVAQHRFGMEPCPWCILQRLLFIVIAVLSLVAAALPSATARRVLAVLVVPVSAGGVAAALWQHFVAAKTASCALTLADRIVGGLGLDTRWPEVFEVRASCADAATQLLGVPFEFWSLALFAVAGVVALACALSRRNRLFN